MIAAFDRAAELLQGSFSFFALFYWLIGGEGADNLGHKVVILVGLRLSVMECCRHTERYVDALICAIDITVSSIQPFSVHLLFNVYVTSVPGRFIQLLLHIRVPDDIPFFERLVGFQFFGDFLVARIAQKHLTVFDFVGLQQGLKRLAPLAFELDPKRHIAIHPDIGPCGLAKS